ncbi:E3 ubiquitin ligase PQT3-like isoform X3 [Salvia miltiorrhiza]|uniref:E3 ubiquitin ligase PQT3-like isoform X3 n=1 Tax=Salvia miltiorrhiza TaxID=226208 RepID=UPI0025ACF219|nr:E3 ubiquitin ligase PQT3-like isoform X3 [Salvia miltiorrhiza]
MSIRFRFRSSMNFDTMEIGSRDSISVTELRSRIMRGKDSQQQQGFDLVFSDAVSGLEYKCDSQIPSGSSVIVKRVPGGTLPSSVVPIEAVKHVVLNESHNLNLAKTGPRNDFDDLGADLCPKPDSDLPCFDQELDENNFMGNKNGLCQHGNDRNILPVAPELMKSNKLHTSNFLTVQGSNLPLELKCSLCKNFFTDAVMIPCCQHSFCEKCIHQVLFATGTCPKCLSRKCTIADLLPNLSLRQATEHLLESHMFDAGFENVMQKYVPDGESGIQANDVSCAITVAQRELEVPQSSCATGKGSNQVLTEALYEQRHRNVPYGNTGSRDFEDFAQSTFQGENQPVHLEAKSQGEADSNAKRKGGFWFDSGAGGRSLSGHGRYRKGVRNCYSCGSSDHLMRDCPISHPNPMFQPGSGAFHGGMQGYAPPYWNASSFPPYTPYANMYNSPSMMPFNPSMVPVGPFAVPPPYVSSVGGILPGLGANMRMGNMEPRRLDHFGLQHCGNKRKKLSNENLERDLLSDDDGSSECYQHYSPQKTHKNREQILSHSDDSLAQRSGRKDQHEKYMHPGVYADEKHEKSRRSFAEREKRLSHVERSNKEDKSRSTERHCDGRHKGHHWDRGLQKDNERNGHYESDSSFGHHSTQRDAKRMVDSDVHDSHRKHHHNRTDHGFDPQTPADRRAKYTERELRQDSSRHGDRLQRVHGFNEDRRDDYRHQKRRAY